MFKQTREKFLDQILCFIASKALPPDKRTAHDRKLVEHVMSIGEIDGSFLDSHELGKSYGTAMALLILNRVR